MEILSLCDGQEALAVIQAGRKRKMKRKGEGLGGRIRERETWKRERVYERIEDTESRADHNRHTATPGCMVINTVAPWKSVVDVRCSLSVATFTTLLASPPYPRGLLRLITLSFSRAITLAGEENCVLPVIMAQRRL